MLRLRLIPKFARLTVASPDCSQFRCLATSSQGAGSAGGGSSGGPRNKDDDADFLSKYLQEGAASDEQFLQRFFNDDSSGGAQRASNRGRGRRAPFRGTGRFGGRRGGSMGRGSRAGRGYGERPTWAKEDEKYEDDVEQFAGGARNEEDMKRKQALEQEWARLDELERMKSQAAKREEEEEGSEEEEEVKSMYTGFLDPKYDDLLKERRQQLKRLRYKDKAYMPSRFDDEDEEEAMDDLDKDSDDDIKGRKGAMDVKGREVLDLSDEEAESEDEVNEEEWDAINDMDKKELEKHLSHRANAKALKKEYEARIEALGEKVSDKQEVLKIQNSVMKKWRSHYNIPRLVTPLEKEEMWEKHKKDPQEWTVEKLAEEFNVCKARVHAILWLWDMRKHGGEVKSAEEETKDFLDRLAYDGDGKPCRLPHMGEDKWVTPWNTKPNYKIMPEDWEGSVRTEEEAIEEASAKEEAMMLEEFIRRMEYNKLQMAGLVQQHKHSRCRPVGGWTYLVEKLGPEGKRGKRGGFRFVVTADGVRRKLNDLEKLTLKREAVRPRRRIL